MFAADDQADAVVRADRLAGLFHAPTVAFASFVSVPAACVPAPHRDLLDHASHMTVAMERLYGEPVGVVVKAVRDGGDGPAAGQGWYEREILLQTAAGSVVQHGIVRIDLRLVAPATAAEIRQGRTPLGRLLIAAGILLDVRRVGLLQVAIGPELQALFAPGPAPGPAALQTFGRVAEIAIDGVPAVELLEIVAPGPLPKVLR